MPAVNARRRGATLAELLVSLATGAAIGTAILLVLVRHEQMATGLAGRSAGSVQLRHGRDALRGELRALSEGGAALLRAADSAIELRSTVGVALACTAPGTGATQVLLTAAGLAGPLPADAWLRSITPGDSVQLRDPATGRWFGGTVESDGPARCTLVAGAADVDARRITLSGVAPPAGPGWIVRLVRPAVWSAYRGSDRAWWLGLRERTDGRWGTVQPVMGPLAGGLRPLVFAALDRRGVPLPASVAADSAWGLRVALPVAGAARDSLVMLVPLRGAP